MSDLSGGEGTRQQPAQTEVDDVLSASDFQVLYVCGMQHSSVLDDKSNAILPPVTH